MADRDSLHRFVFEHLPIRGRLVHLDASWKALLENHRYPDSVRDTLGEAAAAAVLLAATLKFDGHLSLQLQGQGALRLLLAQCTSALGVRALARYQDQPEARDLSALVGQGQLLVTLDNKDAKNVESQRYQGIVSLEHERLAPCLEAYFLNSEQLPTRLWLHADANGASGMLLQRLPYDETQAIGGVDVDDAWRRVQLFGDTLRAEELRQLSDRQILRRLFNEDDVRLFEPAPVFFRCTCSRDRVGGMLLSLGREDVQSILVDQGSVQVRCDFCNRAYEFDAVDVERLFAAFAAPGGRMVH